MKSNLLVFVVIISALVSSAALKPLNNNNNNNVDKLKLLDKQGYEVISDAEEILTPVSDKDNGVDLSDRVKSKPEVLLYGRFYVLRKKGNLDGWYNKYMKSENLFKSYPASTQQYFQYRSQITSTPSPPWQMPNVGLTYRNRSPIIHKPATGRNEDKDTKSHNNDAIFFPGDAESTTTKKYLIRRNSEAPSRVPSENEQHAQEDVRLGHNIRKSQASGKSSHTSSISEKKSSLEAKPDKVANNFDHMTSDEFVTWIKDNLNTEQIDHLVQNSGEEVTTATSDIQYNSFILVPGLKCLEGERMNHRGVCTPKYVHVPSPHDAKMKVKVNQGNTKAKLFELLKTLKKMEADLEVALEGSEAPVLKSEQTTSSDTDSETSTVSQVEMES